MAEDEKSAPAFLSDDELDRANVGNGGGFVWTGGYTATQAGDDPTTAGFKTPLKKIGKLHRGHL